MPRIFLDVPYKEKNQVKRLGARWNPTLKKWFLPEDCDPKPFAKWLPPTPHIDLLPSVYLAKTAYPYPCPECKTHNAFYTLAAEGLIKRKYEEAPEKVSRFVVAYHVQIVPEALADFLAESCPTYFLNEHRDTKAYFNHCRVCKTLISGSLLNNPDTVFLPKTPLEASRITLFEISDSASLEVNCDYWSRSEVDLIGQHSPRKPLEALTGE